MIVHRRTLVRTFGASTSWTDWTMESGGCITTFGSAAVDFVVAMMLSILSLIE